MLPLPRLDAVVLDTADPRRLAEFYSALTGLKIIREDDDWYQLDRPGAGQMTLAFQLAPDHRPPRWPSAEEPQQVHLDFEVDDLDESEQHALAVGARKAEVQPLPDDYRVFLDPAGHPFCLCRPG
jgi:catechol 2,3-dioxygenase-like lactoylglutathione lyase family enzyme